MQCGRCRECFTGDTAIVGEPMCAARGYPDDYTLLVTCPCCQATHSIRIWQSARAAFEDAHEALLEEFGDVVEEDERELPPLRSEPWALAN